MKLTIEQALQQAVEVHKAGKLQDAEALYRAILETQPKHPDANHNLGVLAVSLNKTEAALPLFKIALEANPSQRQFWLSYVDALIKEKQFDNARNVLEQGKKLGLAGQKIDVLEAQLPTILPTLNSKSSSINQISPRNLIKRNQTRSPSQTEINQLLELYQTGQLDLAQILATTLAEQYPNHPFSWKVLGALFKQTGKLQDSLIANQKGLEISPNDAEAHSNLGNTLKELGRLEDAETSYKKAIAIKPDFAEAHSNLGNTLKELGRLEDAETSCKKAIAIKPDFAEAHINLGNTLKELGRLEEAERSYRKAIVIKPDFAEAHTNLGLLLTQTGDLEGSRNMHERAIKLDSKKWNIYYNYSTYLYEISHKDPAIDSMKRAQFIAPKNKLKLIELCLKAISADKNVTKSKVDETYQSSPNLQFGLRSDPLILSRPVENELIVHLRQMNSRVLDQTIDARYGNGKCSLDFELFNDKSQMIKVISQDLTKICRDAVASEVHIYDSFFNIYGAGAGTKIHNHINSHDKYFDLSKRKYSLVYYLDVGDQSGLEPGVLRLFNPDQDIMPRNGMVVIINANKKHHALYDGKKDRIMIGVNFYSI
jgi:tetratricopeptide (TPR) repeat protein